MKIIKKVRPIEVKRAFVATQHIRKFRLPRRRYLPKLTREQYLNRLQSAKKYVKKRSGKYLDDSISKEYKKRLKAYNFVDWYIGEVSVKEVGVWKKAGGLPLAWTKGSLAETVKKVAQSIEKGDEKVARRAKRAIPRIADFLDIIESEKYLYPIVLPGGTMGRKNLEKMKGDIDDGCMRAIVIALSGKKKFRVFLGLPKNRARKKFRR